MNSSTLYEVVKDVPSEAWPEHCHYHKRDNFSTWSICDTDPDPECGIDDEHAVLLFEASMMRWLESTGAMVASRIADDGQEHLVSPIRRSDCGVDLGRSFKGLTRVEALAAACKAVGK